MARRCCKRNPSAAFAAAGAIAGGLVGGVLAAAGAVRLGAPAPELPASSANLSATQAIALARVFSETTARRWAYASTGVLVGAAAGAALLSR